MESQIAVAGIAFLGTLVGTFGGIMTANKLTNYRILQLEKRVEEHNNFGKTIPVIQEKISAIDHRINDLEKKEVL